MENPFSLILERLNSIELLIQGQAAGRIVNTTAPAQIVNTEQLCKFLNLTDSTILTYRKKGIIPYFRVGNKVRYDLNKVLDALQTKKAARSRAHN